MLIQRPRKPKPLWKWPEDKPKPKLAAIHLPHFRVHCDDLETYLGTVYRLRDFDFCKAAGITAGLIPEYLVTGELPTSWQSKNKAEQIRNGQRTSDILLILNVLCFDQFIPAGRYQIDTKPRPKPIELYRVLLERHCDPQNRECERFRERHKRDPDFVKKAATLDNAVNEWLRSQQ